MIPILTDRGTGISLQSFRTEQFKASFISLSALMPVGERNGLLTTLLFSVLRRGCRRYPTLAELNRRLDFLYGTELSLRNFSRGDCMVAGLSLDLLDGAYLPEEEDELLDRALDVVDELLFCPLLDEEGRLLSRYVESEKEHLCNRIRSRKSQPSAYAVHRTKELLFAEDPSGALYRVTEEDVLSVNAEELTAFYRRFLSELRLSAFYVGPKSEEEILSLLEAHFGKHVHASAAGLLPTVTLEGRESPLRVDETLPVTQGHLVMAYRTGVTLKDRLFFACKVFNELLGGTPMSRLFLEVREKRSLCYSCYSAYESYKGVIFVTCGLENQSRAEAEAAIGEQLLQLCRGEYSDEELAMAKESLKNIYRQNEDNPASIENFYFSRSTANATLDVEECVARTEAVTREEIAELAAMLSLNVVYFLEGTLAGEEAYEDED